MKHNTPLDLAEWGRREGSMSPLKRSMALLGVWWEDFGAPTNLGCVVGVILESQWRLHESFIHIKYTDIALY